MWKNELDNRNRSNTSDNSTSHSCFSFNVHDDLISKSFDIESSNNKNNINTDRGKTSKGKASNNNINADTTMTIGYHNYMWLRLRLPPQTLSSLLHIPFLWWAPLLQIIHINIVTILNLIIYFVTFLSSTFSIDSSLISTMCLDQLMVIWTGVRKVSVNMILIVMSFWQWQCQ